MDASLEGENEHAGLVKDILAAQKTEVKLSNLFLFLFPISISNHILLYLCSLSSLLSLPLSFLQANNTPPPRLRKDKSKLELTNKHNKEVLQKQVTTLKESIQIVCKSANPLGKTVDYIQEDFEHMSKEVLVIIIIIIIFQRSLLSQQLLIYISFFTLTMISVGSMEE